MPYHDDERRRTGPFGYPLDDPAALALEEREATQGTTPPAITDPGQQAEYIELNAKIGEAESSLATNEALADSQERDLRNEGVTPYEAARVTGKLREEARTAKLNIANMRAQQAEIEATIKSPTLSLQVLSDTTGATFDSQSTDHGIRSFQYPFGGLAEVNYSGSQAPDPIDSNEKDSTSQATATPNQTEENSQYEPSNLYEGWPKDWEYTHDMTVDPCRWAETVIANLLITKDELLNKLADYAEQLKNISPEFNRVMDDYLSSIRTAGAETLLAPFQGPGGFGSALGSMAGVYNNKQEYDTAVKLVMDVRGEIDRAYNDLRRNNGNLVMVYDKQKALNCQ